MGENLKITLGEEYDEKLLAITLNVVIEAGAKFIEKTWCVGGSQEITTFIFCLQGSCLTVMCETFIGLTIEGAEFLVCPLAKKIEEKRLVSG